MFGLRGFGGDTTGILVLLLAIIGTVLAFIFLVPDKKRASLNGFGKFIHDLINFKFLIVEKILQALYIFFTINIILSGFIMIFKYEGEFALSGLLTMILGPIAIRIAYELVMMAVLLVKNVIQINNKIKGTGEAKADIFAAPTKDAYTEGVVCPKCGEKIAKGEFCTKCGTKVK